MLTEADPSVLEQISEIIDSSALTKYATKEPDWLKVERYIASSDSLELALIETSNALWKKILRQEIELESAKKIMRTLADTLWFLDQRKYIDRAFDIATQHHITVYDALFLACAQMENSTLISCDVRQLEVADKLRIERIQV